MTNVTKSELTTVDGGGNLTFDLCDFILWFVPAPPGGSNPCPYRYRG